MNGLEWWIHDNDAMPGNQATYSSMMQFSVLIQPMQIIHTIATS